MHSQVTPFLVLGPPFLGPKPKGDPADLPEARLEAKVTGRHRFQEQGVLSNNAH